MLRIQAKGLNDTINKMEKAPEKMQVSLSKNIHWSTMRVHREVVFLASGPIIKVRSGKTRAGINWEVDERNLVGRVGSKQIHMRQIEYGGPISAKPPRRFLTIPLDAAKTAAGVARGSIREFKGYFWRSEDNKLFFREEGPDGRLLFRLITRVEQKPKHLFKKAMENSQEDVKRESEFAVKRTLSEFFG